MLYPDEPLTKKFQISKREKLLLKIIAYVVADEIGPPVEYFYEGERRKERHRERIEQTARRLRKRVEKLTVVVP